MALYNEISSSDSSFYNNDVRYISMSFSTSSEGIKSIFDGIGRIEISNSPNYNFDFNQNFSISLYLNSQTGSASIVSKLQSDKSQNRYPFDISLLNNFIVFKRFDGSNLSQVSSSFTTNSTRHVLCQKSGSELQIWINGSKIVSASDASSFSTKNDSSVVIGNGFSGSMSQFMIFSDYLTNEETTNLSSSFDNSPNIGNIIYEHGILTITKPGKYQNVFLSGSTHSYTGSFSSSIEITEHKYKCKIEPDEFDFTYNPSAPINLLSTGSLSPYVTTVGLYNNDGDLIAVGKLGQPVRKSKKIPLNFIIKYDI
jgi:hypothetical protein